MDTFSVSLGIGSCNISKRNIILFTLLVGILHFFMPLIGNILGEKIINILNINANFLLGVILIFIGIEMILELLKKDSKELNLNLINLILIAISVSLDSFSTGIGLFAITDNIILSSTIFSICATSFTYFGLLIGKYGASKLGIYGNLMGIFLLIILGIFYIFR